MRSTQWNDAVSVIDRVTIVLGCFRADDKRLGVSELARRANLPKSTVSRLVSELVEHRYLERDGTGVRLGLRLFELGELAAQPRALRTLALATMADLRDATGHTVHLAVLEGVEVVYVGVIRARNAPAARARLGGRLPAYSTAVGRALLAHAGPDVVANVIDDGLRRAGSSDGAGGIADRAAVYAQLDRVRATGLAYEPEGTAPTCAASAIVSAGGEAVAAISACARAGEFDVATVGPAVRTAALALGRSI